MTLPEYLSALAKLHASGRATEHSYRGDLQQLLSSLCPGVSVTNEPQRIACGAPDYILTRKDIPVGYIEAKDIGVDMDSKSLKEQFDRYRGSLDNLIITDYLEFRFFRNGEPTTSIRIGEVSGGKVKPLPAEFDRFTALIADFAAWQGQSITSPKKLATMMAGKARLLADVIEKAVESDDPSTPLGVTPRLGKVWINDQQYFADVPEVAWNFYIGGYQPAQKWLKDRVGRQLTFDDIRHYQRMIVALTETGKVMEEVDGVGVV